MENECLIIGSDHHNTLGVVESLGQKGISPYVIITSEENKSFVLRSKYIKQGWVCHGNEKILKCVYENFSDKKDTIVIVTNDNIASLVDSHLDELGEFLRLPNAGTQGGIIHWMNKETMDQTAIRIGLNVPKTWVVKRGETISDVTYPCITKSIATICGAKTNTRICKRENELKSFLASQKKYPEVQVQQFIDKEYEFQFIGCSLNGGEEVVIPGRTHIERNGIENTFFLHFAPVEEKHKKTLELAKLFVKETGYSGLFSIEFLHGKDGIDYFLEMNFRNDGNAVCATSYGVNLPYIWYLYNAGGDYRAELPVKDKAGIYFMPEEACMFALMNKEISLSTWFGFKRKANCYAVRFKNDKKPYRTFIKMKIAKMIIKYLKMLTEQAYYPAFITVKQGAELTDGSWEIKIVKHKYKDRWFADPFILDVTDDEVFLLVEEVRYDFPTGRIVKMTIDKETLVLKNLKVLLELDTHLSFPAIYRRDGEVWVYPESSASGKLTLYKYDLANDLFEPYTVLIDKAVSDAVLYQGFEKPCMLATSRPESNGKYVEFYEADDVFGPYVLKDKFLLKDKTGRSAGDIFTYNDKLIRPAQVCNKSYGEALCFQELTKTAGKYDIKEISRVYPQKGFNGLHTFNEYKGFMVIDTRKALHPFFFKLRRLLEEKLKIRL